MHVKNYFYSDKEIKNLNSVEVHITIPSGSSECEVISFTTNNKKIIFITNNYHELRQEYFKDDSDEFFKNTH